MLCYPQISFKILFPPHASWQNPPKLKELRQPYAKVPEALRAFRLLCYFTASIAARSTDSPAL